MPYKEFKIEKLYYSIGEVAKLFGVSASLIRYWEKEFTILKPRKNSAGNRIFTKKDIEKIKLIYHLVKERGFTLEGAKQKLKDSKDKSVDNRKVIDSLKRISNFLEDLKEKL